MQLEYAYDMLERATHIVRRSASGDTLHRFSIACHLAGNRSLATLNGATRSTTIGIDDRLTAAAAGNTYHYNTADTA